MAPRILRSLELISALPQETVEGLLNGQTRSKFTLPQVDMETVFEYGQRLHRDGARADQERLIDALQSLNVRRVLEYQNPVDTMLT